MQNLLSILNTSPLVTKAVVSLGGALIVATIFKFIFQNIIRELIGKTKTKIDDKILDSLQAPVFWTIILGGIYIFVLSLSLSEKFLSITGSILATLLIFLWGIALTQISKFLLKAYDQRQAKSGRLSDAIPFLENLIILGVLGLAVLLILDTWGINITPLLASAGVLGIAVAFAAKDTVSNLFGGISVFFDRPYRVGDYVIIEDKYRGEVVEIGMRSTKIRTRDNVLLTVPNSVMVTNAVINETGFDPKLRIRIPIGVAYGSDLEKVEYTLINLMKEYEEVQKSPSPRVRYRRFGDSAIELEALCVIEKPANRGRIMHELIKEICKVFREEKIDIPYPQMDINLKK